MADYSVTITNAVNVFGPSPTEKWASGTTGTNPLVWGVDNWGSGTEDLPQYVQKLLEDGVSLTEALHKYAQHFLENSVSASADMSSEILTDGSGYTRLFADGASDGESRGSSTWSAVAAASTSYSTATATSVTWSEA